MRHSLVLILLLSPLLFSTGACSSTSGSDAGNQEKIASVEDMYTEAKTALDDQNFESAIKKYESLQSRYPYGRYAQQAQLEIAYAYYKQGEAESAIAAADRFIKQYPNNPHVDYAYYVKGLANFHGESGFLGMQGDPTERDPKAAQDSFAAFKDLVARFPGSKYAPDSRLRMQYLINSLAEYEIHVASYYLRRRAYIAAVNRAKEVLTIYPNSPSTLQALQILVKGYSAMGMRELRDDVQRVLDINFPEQAASQSNMDSEKPL